MEKHLADLIFCSTNFAVSKLASALTLVLSKLKLHHVAILIQFPAGPRSVSSECITLFPSCCCRAVIGLVKLLSLWSMMFFSVFFVVCVVAAVADSKCIAMRC